MTSLQTWMVGIGIAVIVAVMIAAALLAYRLLTGNVITVTAEPEPPCTRKADRAPDRETTEELAERVATPEFVEQVAPSSPIARHRAFSVPKRDGRPEYIEDAFACHANGTRFAVADGVGQSAFPRDWARMVAARFVEHPVTPDRLRSWIRDLSDRFESGIDWDAVEAKLGAWVTDGLRTDSSATTLIGLAFDPPPGDATSPADWYALAVGDSCLFQIRANRLIRSFPIDRPEQFTTVTWALSSKMEHNRRMLAHWATGDSQPGDEFFLVTDALAHWFLAEARNNRAQPWSELWSVESDDAFRRFVSTLRSKGGLRDDDTTVVMLRI